MYQDIDAHFIDRLSQIEEVLLDPIIDRSSLATFNLQWTTLVEDLNTAIEAERLSPSTMLTVHAVADRVSGIVQTFLDLDVLSEELMSSLTLEASSILDSPAVPTPQASNHTIRASVPSYIKPCYEWLLKHIHEPYPSIHIRDTIANVSSFARKDIDGWFVDARKRIGWNALRKTRFSNKRIEIVDAATRFFIEDDPKRPLDPNVELEFAAIETRAKALYSEKFSESDLAAKLDMVVKDMTPEMKVLAKEERHRLLLQKDGENNVGKPRPISSYPSPDRSPNRSPEPDFPSPNFPCNDTAPVLNKLLSGRKRQNSHSDPSDYSDGRPNKRSRLDVLPSSFNGLPSPASSFHEDLDESDSTAASIPSNPPPTPLDRKRRLSDAEVQGAPKRPRNLLVGPPPHAVSGPLSMSTTLLEVSAFDGWFNKYFELPKTPSVDELDASIPLYVEFCDTSVFKDNALLLSSSSLYPTSSPEVPASFIPSSISSSPSLPHEAPPLSLDMCSTEFDFTDFLVPSDFTHSFDERDVVDGQGYSLPFDIPPLDIGFSLNAFDPYAMPPAPSVDDPILPEVSTHVSTNPSSEVDWSFSQFIPPRPPLPVVSSEANFSDLLNIFPPINLFESFVPMMLNPTQCNSGTVDATLADRAAKEKQLQEMKETTRRLEEELAASR